MCEHSEWLVPSLANHYRYIFSLADEGRAKGGGHHPMRFRWLESLGLKATLW